MDATKAVEEAVRLDDSLGNVLANPLLDTVFDNPQEVMPKTVCGRLGDVKGNSLVDTVADT